MQGLPCRSSMAFVVQLERCKPSLVRRRFAPSSTEHLLHIVSDRPGGPHGAAGRSAPPLASHHSPVPRTDPQAPGRVTTLPPWPQQGPDCMDYGVANNATRCERPCAEQPHKLPTPRALPTPAAALCWRPAPQLRQRQRHHRQRQRHHRARKSSQRIAGVTLRKGRFAGHVVQPPVVAIEPTDRFELWAESQRVSGMRANRRPQSSPLGLSSNSWRPTAELAELTRRTHPRVRLRPLEEPTQSLKRISIMGMVHGWLDSCSAVPSPHSERSMLAFADLTLFRRRV